MATDEIYICPHGVDMSLKMESRVKDGRYMSQITQNFCTQCLREMWPYQMPPTPNSGAG